MKKKAEDPANRASVGEALRSVTGRRWRPSYELREVPPATEDAAAAQATEEEWVRRFIDEFDAEELPARGPPSGEVPGDEREGIEGEHEAQAMTSNEKGP